MINEPKILIVDLEKEDEVISAQLLQAQKLEAIRSLAAGVAHNLNNLFMGIYGSTSLMLLHSDSGHPHFEHLKRIEDMVQRGANLTRQLNRLCRGRGSREQCSTFNLSTFHLSI